MAQLPQWQLARSVQQACSPILHSPINFIEVKIFLCIGDDGPERWQCKTGHIHMDGPLLPLPLYTCTSSDYVFYACTCLFHSESRQRQSVGVWGR